MIDIIFLGLDHSHPSDFVYGVIPDYWLLVFIKSKALFHTAKGDVHAQPGCVAIYPPGTLVYYQADGEDYVNSYVRFNTDEDFIVNGNYPKGVPIDINLPANIDYLLRIISSERCSGGNNTSNIVRHAMRTIFHKIIESAESKAMDEQRKKLLDLRYEIIVSPYLDWNLEDMAKRLHVSSGYLSVLYKKEFGISCKEDIVNHRIELAKDMLANTTGPAVKVASMCGYQCAEYFTRQFKKKVGITPGEYREQVKKSKTKPQ